MLVGDSCGSDPSPLWINTLVHTAYRKVLSTHKNWSLSNFKCPVICYSDSTSEYISGEEVKLSVGDIYKSGLRCVTVLIGVFNRVSGQPLLGVVNQPFHTQHGSR
jgi:hypothetical protein